MSLSHLSDQSFVPLLLLLPSTVTSPSFFQGHSQITSLHKHLLLLFPLMVKSLIHPKHQSPPQEPQESNPTRTTRIKTHKRGLRRPISIDLRYQHRSTSIKTHSHRPTSTDPQASRPISINP